MKIIYTGSLINMAIITTAIMIIDRRVMVFKVGASAQHLPVNLFGSGPVLTCTSQVPGESSGLASYLHLQFKVSLIYGAYTLRRESL